MKKQNLKLNEYFKTSDLALATAISLFYPIDAIDKTDSQRAIFLFKRDENLDQFIQAYWRGELRVNPLAYFNQLKIIKSRLYEK